MHRDNPLLDPEAGPELPAKAVQMLQLVAAEAIRTRRTIKPDGMLVEFTLLFPTSLWPQVQWGDLARYIAGAGRNGLLTMTWSFETDGCTLALTDRGAKYVTAAPPVFLLQPEHGDTGWRANDTIPVPQWRLLEGNIVHGVQRFQIDKILRRNGTCTVWAVGSEHSEVYAPDDTVTVERASLLAAQHPASIV